jgi:glycerol-3-phosphate dehydrogenase (NAD(P)+)
MSAAAIGVVGAGAWGTALAQMLAANGTPVGLWALEDGLADAINTDRRNQLYLPSAALAPSIRATGNLADLAACDTLLLVTPAQHLASVLARLPHIPRDLVLCSKGIEAGTGRMMHEVAHEAAPASDIAVLSGPTFAHEVAAGLPTAITLACGGGGDQWDRLAPVIARPAFRPYYSDDVIGAEVGGAVKNVLAIACGVVDGLGLGQNARAALITRGFAEMGRYGDALGARAETLAGLCGLGDLVLTCSSTSSRNFALGKAMGEGRNPAELMADRRTVAEGAFTAPVLAELATRRGVAMPICQAVHRLLQGAAAGDIMRELLARPLTAEGTRN